VETFKQVNWDTTCYRVRASNGGAGSSAGVRERFVPLDTNPNSQSYLYAYLLLPDGGKVEFKAAQRPANGNYYYRYHVTAIYDPYGLKTTVASEVVGPHNLRRITRVTEPAGRYLQFNYPPNSNKPRIASVTASDGRTVNYYYACCNNWALERVRYYSNAAWDARYQYTNSNIGGDLPALLKTCDDPMYAGPMKRISYEYKTGQNADLTDAVYGQVWKVRYWDGNSDPYSGPVVSTLTIGQSNPLSHATRKETRGDNKWRTFIYNGAGQGYLAWASDFSDRYARQTYDQTTKYITSVTDRRGNTTDYTVNRITGNVTRVQFPAIVTPSPAPRGEINYTYTNNYYLRTVQGEAGPTQTTTITRDTNNRVTRIDYPDGGYETFTDYDAFNQARTHLMTTGGPETFTFDSTNGRKLTYRNPDNPGGNPTASYQYDNRGRVSDITDTLNHTTSFTYNDRGQLEVTTLPPDPVDGQRHKITNFYNPDGTLQYRTDELGANANDPTHTTSYTYDDYRRLKSVKGPVRGQGNNNRYTTDFYYGANPTYDVTDYKYTDSNVTWVKRPSGKKINTHYDDNRRKGYVIVASGLPEAAKTSYEYDPVGNLTRVTAPEQQPGGLFANTSPTKTEYDERNRPWRITDALNHATTITYDAAGRKKQVTRSNGQTVTYDTFDDMNRVTQQTVTQDPNLPAVTKYEYYASGPANLLYRMQDPHRTIYGDYFYTYAWDSMGRKLGVLYPPDTCSPPAQTFEAFTYDDAGRLETFQNRAGKVQTFHYDARNRVKWFDWSDGAAPRVDFNYDAASRLTDINNPNATVHRDYYNDNLLYKETEQILLAGGTSKTVTYAYDADGNRNSTIYPGNAYTFAYDYTGRNQLWKIKSGATALATYGYNRNGDMTSLSRNPPNTGSTYTYDALDRIKRVDHSLNGSHRTFDYDYDNVGNRLWTKRGPAAGGLFYGDVFGYDLNDQVISVFLDVQFPAGGAPDPGDQTIFYDRNGNRSSFEPYDWLETYTINELNQYTLRNLSDREEPERPTPTPRPRPSPTPRPTPLGQQAAAYDYTGNMTTHFDGSSYLYDGQNRLLQATKDGVTIEFKYDGLNRQVSRSNSVDGTTTFSVWDDWDLIEEYRSGNNVRARYLHGPNGVIKDLSSSNYYFQDGSGTTSHLSDSNGNLREWYLYDLQGSPSFFAADGNQRDPNQTAFGVRHLFTGQQWYSEIGMYDLRNRFYSPDIGRFIQPDPIGFAGDATNLYRYAGNNPVTYSDPSGEYAVYKAAGRYWYYIVNPGYQTGGYVPGSRGWCAAGCQILAGGYLGSTYYHMPNTDYWFQGRALGPATPIGAVVATGWQNRRYPSLSKEDYEATYPGSPVNHTGIFLGFDENGNAIILDQYTGKPLGKSTYSRDEWYEVYVPKKNGPYASGEATGQGGGDGGLTPYLASRYNRYYGYLPTSPTTNFAGGLAMPGGWHSPAGGPNFGVYTPTGGPIPNSSFGPDNYYSGLDPIAAVGSTYGEGFRGMYNFP
jgi:RHS repeat-associated protein